MSRHISAKTVLRAAGAIDGMEAEGLKDVLKLILGDHPKAVIDALERLEILGELAPLPLEPAEAPPDEEPLYKVVITQASQKIGLIRWIREVTGAGLKEAKEMVEMTFASAYSYKVGEEEFRAWMMPGVMGMHLTREAADRLIRFLRQCSDSAAKRFREPEVGVAVLEQERHYSFREPPYAMVGLSDKF